MTKERTESVMKRYPVDPDKLRDLIETGHTRWEAALKLGVPPHAVAEWCFVHKIRSGTSQIRSRIDWTQDKIDHIRESLGRGETLYQIGIYLGIDPKQVGKACKKHGIETHRRGPKDAEGHPNWSGGRMIDPDGYVLIYCPDHPMARHRGLGLRPQYVPEHRLVMSDVLGRSLLEREVVHHKNGKKDDNRPENLELFDTNSDHLRHELTGRCPKWTEEGKRKILDAVTGPRKKSIPHLPKEDAPKNI